MKKNISKIVLAFLGAAVFITGCKKKDDINWYRPIGTPMASYVKFIDALPQSSLDFYGYYTKMITGVAYAKDQNYVNTPYGNIIIYATNANQTSNRITASTNAANPQVNGQGLWAMHYQTMIACKANDSSGAETMILLRDDLTDPAAGMAHIRFVNLAQRGTSKYKAVDFNTTSGPKGSVTIFDSLMYQVPSNAVRIDAAKGFATPGLGIFTSGPFTPVPAGSYDFEVKSNDGTVTVASMAGVTLTAGRIYTFFTSGTVGGAAAPTMTMLTHLPNASN